ncbi:MAG: hypothetical protein H0U75_05200 [Legionella sp.]|nr:hypothetical protein [Legionella sp.]
MRWAPYVPVAERRAIALKKMQQLKKKGHMIQPIEIQGRTIASTFWGKAWCSHLESFCDYDNRLPRGRTYVRNGSVCHLEIGKGQVKAMVSGGSIYNIKIAIEPLVLENWQTIKSTCMGKISSLLDFLSGKLSTGVMDVVCHPEGGLFPLSHDLQLHCDCPDWATMCKHVAAVLYGVGSRLDADPAQLFKLRGVNFEELIDVNQAVLNVTSTQSGRRKRLDDTAFTDVFNFETAEESTNNLSPAVLHHAPMNFPKRLTGQTILEKRTQLQLTKNEFAKRIGVSVTSITLWEAKGDKTITPHTVSLKKLQDAW